GRNVTFHLHLPRGRYREHVEHHDDGEQRQHRQRHGTNVRESRDEPHDGGERHDQREAARGEGEIAAEWPEQRVRQVTRPVCLAAAGDCRLGHFGATTRVSTASRTSSLDRPSTSTSGDTTTRWRRT